MHAFNDMLKAGFCEARKQFGVSFTVAGISGTFKGVQHSTSDMLILGSGGFMQDYAGGLEYLTADVTIPNGRKVTIGGVVYRTEHASGESIDPVRMVFLTGVDK